MKKDKSFTLIELLVVIAIIGLLASILIVAVGTAKINAYDAVRLTEIRQFGEGFDVCYMADEIYPDSDIPFPPGIPNFWDDRNDAEGWKYSISCGPCHGNFQLAVKNCSPVEIKDPINVGSLAYYYFRFSPTATTYNGTPINPICKGRYAFMAHLQSPKYENGLCFDEPAYYEFWYILGAY